MRGRPRSNTNSHNQNKENTPTTNGNAPLSINGDGEESSRHTVQSVERTFDILEKLVQLHRPVALSELSQLLGLNISTVHRLLGTLIERGYARQEQNSRYSVGSRLLELANGMTEQTDVRAEARPMLEWLASEVGETANLAVRSGDNLVYIDQVQADRLVRMFTQVGSSAPLYCTGAGKLFLAYAADSANFDHEFNRYLLENLLEPRTRATLTKAQALKEELFRIRQRGYSFDNEEMEEGVLCVAAPIFDRQSHLIAAISVSGPTSRLGGDSIARVLEPVQAAARAISAQLGYIAA